MIPYGRQHIEQEEIDAVSEVLQSDFITQGPKVPLFEAKVIKAVGGKYAVAVNSATSGLHIACLALGFGRDKLLWTSPNSFVASSNVALLCGGNVDFVDIDPGTLNMSVTQLRKKLEQAEKASALPDIVMPVHFGGEPCDMREIHNLAKQYGFAIIEDASHAIGAHYQDTRIGDCRYSDITVFSFHPVKIITTAEGGVAMTNDAGLAEKMAMLRTHGVTRDTDLFVGDADGPWSFQQLELGLNYRMTDIQAALGAIQISRLEAFIERRQVLAKQYDALLKNLPVISQVRHVDNRSSLHLYVVRIDPDATDVSRKQAFAGMRSGGVGVNVHYIPIHTHPYYQKLGFNAGDFPQAENYYAQALTLPLYPDLSDEEQLKVVATLKQVLDG